ncbi:SapC family protein [Sphingomonas hengshuiensis]|uniref:SapC family protein n=1 Tax=Sphingomonas hengshuiensis TaxID=1609977 RepID=UPI000AC03D31|nr:SapC family protein [Sphingomonas hengshuiensis]
MSNALPLPLFYRAPQALSLERHRDWRLRMGDYRFAARTPYVPMVIGEFVAAARHYPILFADAELPSPVALLGLGEDNLFVTDGAWTEGMHVPAYVRRYPFGFVATGDTEQFALIADTASERFADSGDEGVALFEDGKPSALTHQALEFCEFYRRDAAATAAFCKALKASDLLVSRRADVTLPDGRKLGIDGFLVVDPARFAALDDATIVAWHKSGWLALVHSHLASLDHFNTLLARQSARTESADSSQSSANLPVEHPVHC